MTSYSNFFEMLDAIEAKMQDPRCKEAGLTPYTGEPLLTSMDLGWIVALPLSERDETFQFSVSLRQIKIDRQDPRWADAYARLQSFTTHFITCPKHGVVKGIPIHKLQGKKEGSETLVCIPCVAERMVNPVRTSANLSI